MWEISPAIRHVMAAHNKTINDEGAALILNQFNSTELASVARDVEYYSGCLELQVEAAFDSIEDILIKKGLIDSEKKFWPPAADGMPPR